MFAPIMNIEESVNPRTNQTNYIIRLDQTKFLFPTNFGLNQTRSRFKLDPSKANDICTLIIPDDGVKALMDIGVNVAHTNPNPEYPDEPLYSFVNVKVNYAGTIPVKMCLVDTRTQPPAVTPLTPANAVEIDKAYDGRAIEMVRAIITTYQNDPAINRRTLYLRTLYVHITNAVSPIQFDPWADAYGAPAMPDNLPF